MLKISFLNAGFLHAILIELNIGSYPFFQILTLAVAENAISGTIPNELGELSMLETLMACEL